jgi:cytochrome c6
MSYGEKSRACHATAHAPHFHVTKVLTLRTSCYVYVRLIEPVIGNSGTQAHTVWYFPSIFFQFAKGAAAVGAAAVIATQPAFAGNVGAGEQVFNANCAACHAGGQNVIMPEKTLEKEALDQYLAGGRSEKSIITQVTGGKNAMPAFGGRLSDEDIADVAAYVIKSSDEGWE